MIGAIFTKELTELRRDGRVVLIGVLLGVLALGSSVFGVTTNAERDREVRAAQRDDRQAFTNQGDKDPHSAAHFGRLAHKPVPPLAVFDPGVVPYLGQVVWLEAHRQSPAMFRSAEDALELRRLADLSPAGVLATLLPLLMLLAGYGAFVGERERGTLRQVVGAGVSLQALFAGKIAALATLGTVVCITVIGVSAGFAMAAGKAPTLDVFTRAAVLFIGYTAYSLIFAALAVFVSAHCRRTHSALMVLLVVWALSTIVTPRVAVTIAERMHPIAQSTAFWTHISDVMGRNKPPRDSAEYRAIEREVLGGALGRSIGETENASAGVNRAGLRLEVSERLYAAVYAKAYDELYATYDAQRRARRLLSFLSPAIALHDFSGTLAGTDVSAHHHFVLEAEQQRHRVVRAINEDLMLNGAGRKDYLADEDLWRRVPEFTYQAPRIASALRVAGSELLALCLWAVGTGALAWHSSRRQSPI